MADQKRRDPNLDNPATQSDPVEPPPPITDPGRGPGYGGGGGVTPPGEGGSSGGETGTTKG